MLSHSPEARFALADNLVQTVRALTESHDEILAPPCGDMLDTLRRYETQHSERDFAVAEPSNGNTYGPATVSPEERERIRDRDDARQRATEPTYTAEQVRALQAEDRELIDGQRREIAVAGEQARLEIERLYGEVRKQREYAEHLERRLQEAKLNPDIEPALQRVVWSLRAGALQAGELAHFFGEDWPTRNFLQTQLGRALDDLTAPAKNPEPA